MVDLAAVEALGLWLLAVVLRDVAEEEPLRAAYYRQALHAWTLRLARRVPGGGAEEAQVSREQCENLKSLGYITGDCK